MPIAVLQTAELTAQCARLPVSATSFVYPELSGVGQNTGFE